MNINRTLVSYINKRQVPRHMVRRYKHTSIAYGPISHTPDMTIVTRKKYRGYEVSVSASTIDILRDGIVVYTPSYTRRSMYYDFSYPSDDRCVAVVDDRLYFVADEGDTLLEYNLDLLSQFIDIGEQSSYHPKVISRGVLDFAVVDHSKIYFISEEGSVKRHKSLLEYDLNSGERGGEEAHTCIVWCEGYLLTASHDDSDHKNVFRLFDEGVSLLSDAVVCSEDEKVDTSNHVHRMVAFKRHRITVFVCAGYNDRIHVLGEINRSLQVLMMNVVSYVDSICTSIKTIRLVGSKSVEVYGEAMVEYNMKSFKRRLTLVI